jgi:hypothetical protein
MEQFKLFQMVDYFVSHALIWQFWLAVNLKYVGVSTEELVYGEFPFVTS